MSGLQVAIVTPESTVLEQKAEFVALPLVDGEIGILTGHAPMIGRLGYGEMRVRDGKSTSRFYVDGGFVQVADNLVSVLTGSAISVGKLNRDEVRRRLADAEQRSAGANGPELAILRQTVDQAKAQLRILERPQ